MRARAKFANVIPLLTMMSRILLSYFTSLTVLPPFSPGHAKVGIATALGLQQGIAHKKGARREIQLVKSGRHKTGAIGRIHAPGRRDAKAITRKAGVAATELRIVVMARIDLPAVPAGAAIEPGEVRRDIPLRHGVRGRAVNLLRQVFNARQRHTNRCVYIVLPGPLVLRRLEQAGELKGAASMALLESTLWL